MATKITLKQLADDIVELLTGGGGALEKDITSNVTVGAATSGSKFPKGQSFTEFAEKILRTDVMPAFNFSASGAGTKEIGTSVNGSTLTLSITNLASVTVPIEKVEFYAGTTLLDTKTFVSGQANYTYVYSPTISANLTLKAKLYYNNTSAEKSSSFAFIYGKFYGVTNVASMNDAIATGLIPGFTKVVNNQKGLSWTGVNLVDQKFCYMYPTSLGALSSIKDGNGFSQIEGYTRYTVNLTYPTDNASVSYYVYLLNDPTTGSGFSQIYA